MKYACLVFADERVSPEQRRALEQLAAGASAGRRERAATVLGPSRRAATVHRRGGEPTIALGPRYRGAAELAALVVIDARDLDEALGIAAELGRGALGIEVRPIRTPLERRGPRRITSARITPLHVRH